MGQTASSDRAHGLSRLLRLVGLVAAGLLLMSCGDGSGEGPSVDPSRTPVLPSSTAEPSSTRSPDNADGTRTPRSTVTVTASADEETQPPSEAPSESGGTSDTASDSTEVPTWAWWLVALAILVALVAIIILVGRRRRGGAWAADFAAVGDEVAWFTNTLLPQLVAAGSLQQVAGGWAVGESRVAAAEDRLTTLEATAPDDAARMRARALRDAVRRAKQEVQRLVATATGVVPTADLIAVGVRLEDAQAAARIGMRSREAQ